MYRITVRLPDRVFETETDGTASFLQLLQSGDVPVHAPCGGNGTCKHCTITVTGNAVDSEGNLRLYHEEQLLACRCRPAGDCIVEPEAEHDLRVRTDEVQIPAGGTGLGFAVDIGTTTIAVYLYDLATGVCLKTAGEMNAQRAYGADVLSRINYCAEPGGLDRLTAIIRDQILRLARSLCTSIEEIRRISVAGNTVMEHIFAGLSPVTIGVAPFTPLSLFGEEAPASAYFEGFAPDCSLYLCPAVAGYVGGDITAGLLSSGAFDSEGNILFIDVGTNGEMGFGNKSGFLTCATAAGPAFEGAGIECGSPAKAGAVNTVAPDLSFTVLGDAEPASVCGSGLIDAVAALLKNDIIDETGRMDGEKYCFTDRVWISGKDVRQLQLAKAAIRAGIETMLERCGKTYGDIDSVLIAGGFGAYMSIPSACAIGLLPPALAQKTRHIGNSAGKGAALALTPEGREALREITAKCTYEELSASPLFSNHYIDAMMFDEE